MPINRSKVIFIILVAVPVIMLMAYNSVSLSPFFFPFAYVVDNPRAINTPATNVVLLTSFNNNSNDTIECVKANVYNMTFPLCLYSDDSDWPVSVWARKGKYFEAEEVTIFLPLFHSDHRLQFVDIGANLGVWSLPAARLTKVVSVEPNRLSMSRLAKAVKLGAVTDNITLINNGVSNVHSTLILRIHRNNQGHSFLIKTIKKYRGGSPYNTVWSINTILLNDLLPFMRLRAALMKVDTEGHEMHIFTNSSAGKFFDRIDVPVVFVEWFILRRSKRNIVEPFLNFFYSRNYVVYNVGYTRLARNYRRWPFNVLFVKSSFVYRFAN